MRIKDTASKYLQRPYPMRRSTTEAAPPCGQGLTLVLITAQLEPCLTHKNTLHTLIIPEHLLLTGYRTPTRTPYPIQSAQVEVRSGRV